MFAMTNDHQYTTQTKLCQFDNIKNSEFLHYSEDIPDALQSHWPSILLDSLQMLQLNQDSHPSVVQRYMIHGHALFNDVEKIVIP